MATPPNVANLSLLKGIIKMGPVGTGPLSDVGECSSFTTSMSADPLPYNSRRHPKRVVVKTAILGQAMEVGITMSEWADENVAMWAMGEATGSPPVIAIGAAAEIRRWIRYIGQNEVGQAYQVDLFDVSLVPDGDLEWLSDADWSEMQLTGTVNADPVTGEFGEIRPITAGVEVTAGSPPL